AQKRAVGGVDDRVHLLLRDVALQHLEAPHPGAGVSVAHDYSTPLRDPIFLPHSYRSASSTARCAARRAGTAAASKATRPPPTTPAASRNHHPTRNGISAPSSPGAAQFISNARSPPAGTPARQLTSASVSACVSTSLRICPRRIPSARSTPSSRVWSSTFVV